jgi:hypothetical protein
MYNKTKWLLDSNNKLKNLLASNGIIFYISGTVTIIQQIEYNPIKQVKENNQGE